MKCRICGREVPSETKYCPSCGSRIDAGPDMEELESEIAGKVELFMNQQEAENSSSDTGETKEDKTLSGSADRHADESIYDDISRSLNEDEDEYYARARSHSSAEGGYSAASRERSSGTDHGTYNPDEKNTKKPKKTGLIAGIIIAVVLVIAVIVVCIFIFAKSGSTEEESEETQEIAEDTIYTASIEDGGSYSAPLEISLESVLGYRIFYTLDGSTPSTDSTLYSGSITLDESYIDSTEGTQITLKAVSYTDSSIKSGEFEITFTLVYAEIDSPEISPASGNYTSTTYITISAVSGAKIYYTTDGSTPTEESSLYTGQFELPRGNTVISAIAVKNGMSSAVTTAVYNLDIPSVYSYSEAKDIILAYLIDKGEVADEEGNLPSSGETDEEGNVLSSGYVDFMDGGTCIIDNDQYIVVLCSFYDSEGNETQSRIYGVDDQSGKYTELEESDSGYTKK